MMDNIEFDPATVPFGAEACGCYVDGIEEWLIPCFATIHKDIKVEKCQ